MKYIFLFSFLLAVTSSRAQWEWQNPLPQGNNLESVFFTSLSTGYAVGLGGTILKTTDGGNNWSFQNSGTTAFLYSVYFTSENKGFVVGMGGNYSIILETIDAGQTWTNITPFNTSGLYAVFFPTADTGYIAGDQGVILRTTDGGSTWTDHSLTPYPNYFHSLYFVTGKLGFVAGASGILRTNDAGMTWASVYPGPPPILHSIWFADMNHGYAVGEGCILKTTNGGTAWVYDSLPSSYYLNAVRFSSPDTGIIMGVHGYYGIIMETFNAGTTWITKNDSVHGCNALVSRGSSSWVGVGQFGYTITSTDNFNSWNHISTGTYNILNSISFPDHENGFVAGNFGTILKTVNHGQTWTIENSKTSRNLYGICFPSSFTGYAVGDSGLILKSVDGGIIWNTLVSGTSNPLVSVHFPIFNTGYAVGLHGTILKTTDGITWQSQNSGITYDLNSVFFTSQDTGFVAGGYFGWSYGLILKTTNGGADWVLISEFFPAELFNLFMLNKNMGYAVGANGIVVKTTNGFATWETQQLPNFLTGVSCIDSLTGYIGAWNGNFFKTTDGGTTWVEYYSGSKSDKEAVCFTDADHGYLVGWGGSIMYTDQGSIIGVNDHNNRTSAEQDVFVAPNPCSSNVSIKFESNGTARAEIYLYDYLGKQVRHMSVSSQPKGEQKVIINVTGLSNGLYLCRIKINNEYLSKKIIVTN
jgi:photosystem II stability/assembly factor-like uncharacterized protein